MEYYQKSLALSEEQGSKPGIAIDLGNIGNVYSHLSDYGHALEYYQRALAIYEEIGSKSGIAHILGSIGNVYHNIADYSQAIVYIKKSLKINEELGDKSGIGHNLGVIGSVYWHLSDYANALEYMQKSLAIGEEIGNKKFITENLGNIGETYAKKEFEGYNPALAEEYLHKALAISEEIGFRNSSCFLHKYLVTLYENEHRLEEAFEHFKKFYALEKEVQNEEAKKQAGLMEQRKQAAEHEKYLAVERAEAATTRRILHNTLPPVIADRLINNETFIADQYEGGVGSVYGLGKLHRNHRHCTSTTSDISSEFHFFYRRCSDAETRIGEN